MSGQPPRRSVSQVHETQFSGTQCRRVKRNSFSTTAVVYSTPETAAFHVWLKPGLYIACSLYSIG